MIREPRKEDCRVQWCRAFESELPGRHDSQLGPRCRDRQDCTVFRAPVLADDEHQITGVVTDIDEDEHLVEIDITVTNAKGETRVFGTAAIQIEIADACAAR